MKKTSKGFTLIEVLFAILILSMMALFLLPALGVNLDASKKTKDTADTIFILQEAVETSKKRPVGNYTENINGKDVVINIEEYSNPNLKANYKKIMASFGYKTFELIEAYDE